MIDTSRRNIVWLIVGICGLSGLGFVTNTLAPDSWAVLFLFFSLLFLTAFALSLFVLNIVRRAILVGGGVFGFFFLRYLGLHEPLYIMLLAACLISLELYLQKR